MTKRSPFRYFKTSPEIIRLAVMLYVRFNRWVHEHVLEAVQRRLDENPQAMRQRRETVEHPFGTFKARMGATHFLMKRLKNVRTEMALSVLAHNLTRVINILGIGPLIVAIRA